MGSAAGLLHALRVELRRTRLIPRRRAQRDEREVVWILNEHVVRTQLVGPSVGINRYATQVFRCDEF